VSRAIIDEKAVKKVLKGSDKVLLQVWIEREYAEAIKHMCYKYNISVSSFLRRLILFTIFKLEPDVMIWEGLGVAKKE